MVLSQVSLTFHFEMYVENISGLYDIICFLMPIGNIVRTIEGRIIDVCMVSRNFPIHSSILYFS